MNRTRPRRIGPYHLGFGLLALLLTVAALLVVAQATDWNAYVVWVASLGVATLAVYVYDKVASTLSGAPRAPESLLHALSLLGGFGGGWLGVLLLRHKSNFRRHPAFVPVLLLSTALHGGLYYALYALR